MERQIAVQMTVKDASGELLAPEPTEQVRAGLALLAKGLDVRPYSVPEMLFFPEGSRPELLLHAGLYMLLCSLGGLDQDVKLELMKFAVGELKKILPVEVEWDLYDTDDEARRVIGRVKQRVPQRAAEERIGLGEAYPSGLPRM